MITRKPTTPTDPLTEIRVGPAARTGNPTIVDRDDPEVIYLTPGQSMTGRIYLGWCAHIPDGGCDRDPVTDPHEDLGYVGQTVQPLYARWAQHLARYRPGADRKTNNSAVYRNRAHLTGFSADPRVYTTPDALTAAEDRAIKNLWPAWNIQGQDRRNPATRATRSYRRPDRLAPWWGAGHLGWALFTALMSALVTVVLIKLAAPVLAYLIEAALVLIITGGTKPAWEAARRTARRRIARSKAR